MVGGRLVASSWIIGSLAGNRDATRSATDDAGGTRSDSRPPPVFPIVTAIPELHFITQPYLFSHPRGGFPGVRPTAAAFDRDGDTTMDNSRQLRQRLFVDPEVQAALILRVVTYWMLCLAAVALMLVCWQIIAGPPRPIFAHLEDLWFRFGPPFFASLVVLPLILMDIIRLSNRFSGPLIRVRRSMRALARGETVPLLRFRQGDFWKDFADEFNAVAQRVEELERILQAGGMVRRDSERSDSPAVAEKQARLPREESGSIRPMVLSTGGADYLPPSLVDQG